MKDYKKIEVTGEKITVKDNTTSIDYADYKVGKLQPAYIAEGRYSIETI